MKMKIEDFEEIQLAIQRVLASHPKAREDYKNSGLSDMRFRWDVLKCSKYNITKLYSYLNDSHIDTALKKILG